MGFYLVFGGGGFGSFVERCRCRCPGLTFNRMRIGRGEELSVAVSWENDNNNGHVDTGTDGRQDFTIASPTSSGSEGGTEMRRIGESMSLEFEGSNEKKPSGRQFEREKGTDDDDMDML